MEILTFSSVADRFGVSSATISRWVKDGKLKQGPKAGKQKTVTQESVDALASNSAFQIGRESAKSNSNKRIVAQIYTKKEEVEELKQRIEKLEELIKSLAEDVKKLRNITQKHEKESNNARNITQNNEKNGILKKGRQKTKKKD